METETNLVDRYTDERYIQFVKDMIEAGLEPFHYEGRFFYSGPAVTTNEEFDRQAVYRATKVHLRTDNMGLEYVMYPG